MANVIRHKRGTSVPAASDFTDTAELLVRTDTGVVYTKKDDGTVVAIAGGGGSTTLANLTDTSFSGLATNDILKYNGTNWVNSPGDNDYGLITDTATASFDYGSI